MSPIRAALKRPVTVSVACLAAMLCGLVALQVVPLQLLPGGFEAPGMTLIFPYPNADPLSVERDVARPVEEALGTVQSLTSVNVTCSPNRARFNLEFGGHTDMALAVLEVRDRLERIRGELPTEAQRFFLWRHSASSFPDMAYGALVPEELGLDGFQILERRLLPKLGRIDGVAAVDTWGGLVDRQARIELDEDMVRAHRVDMYDLVSRLGQENFNLPAGTLRDGGRQLFVRAVAPFDSLEDVESYPVDRVLTLGDIAEGSVAAGYRDRVSRMDGQPIVWVVIRKESGQNTVDVCRRVREAAETIGSDPALQGFELLPLWDAGESIEAALSTLTQSIIWGGLLAMLVLLLFFRDWRATVVVAAAIPFSVLVALAVLTALGYSLNVLTLAGLTLAVGMLVDNAIVVVENVVRRRESGEDLATAASEGSGEVALAISLATLTTIVVFLPLVFVADEPRVRVMIENLAGPISFGLIASLLTALLVVPLLAARLKTGHGEPRGTGLLGFLRSQALRVVGWVLDRRIETALGVVAVLGFSFWWLSGRIEPAEDGSGMMSDRVRVGIELDASTTLSEANDVFAFYEKLLIPRMAEFGGEHVQVRFDRGGGSVELRLLPADQRGTMDEIRDQLKEELPELPGVRLRFRGGEEEGEGGEQGAKVTVSLQGPDTEVLFELASLLRGRLRETGLFEDVSDGLGEGAREVRVELDREAVSRAGTAPRAILGTVGYQLRGSRLRDLRLGDEDVPLIVSYQEPEAGEGVAWLRSTTIATAGGPVALDSLARVTTGRGPRSIRRVDGKTEASITATADGESGARAHRAVKQVMATFPLPDGVSYQLGGSFRAFEEQVAEIMKVLVLGIAFMFLIIGVLFESFLLPIAVLPSIPFAFVGGYLALWITGTPQDVIATLGSIVLAGIVVNNAIVLVDAINRSLESGHTSRAAVLNGVRDRFRPVVLTAATTIVGLLPMAWTAATEGVLSYHSLARGVIGGLAISTVGTLVAVPLAWLLLDDLRRLLGRTVGAYWRST